MAHVPPARHLLRARDLADARYFEPLGVDDLAAAAGLSRAHFSREFRRTFGESPHAYLLTRRLATCFDEQGEPTMKIANTQLWVHDQDEALAFYTEKLGMEVRADVTLAEMGDFRWLTVGPPGQEDFSIVLMAIPGSPVMSAETAEEVRGLMAKGFAGTVFLTTDDCQASYEELKGRGVEFTEEPEERPYGIDAGFRDPSGNSFRLTQVQLPALA
jgi:catechol 2,3-dioxygenase-like lactoylglutathione lyase family enzyme